MRAFLILTAGFAAGLLAGLLTASPAAAAAAQTTGIPTVENPADPPRERTVQFDEIWRAGADDQAEYLFGVIMDVAEDELGNVYLLDSQQQEVHKFDADGRWLGRIVRQGEGPGEIEHCYQLRYLGDGALGMMKVVPPTMIRVATDGQPLESVRFEATSPDEPIRWGGVYSFECAGGRLFGAGIFQLRDGFDGEQISFVASFDPDGSERHRFASWRGGYDFTRPIRVVELDQYHPFADWDLDDAGRLYHTVARDEYAIEVCDADGAPLRRITRPCVPHRRTGAEKERTKEQWTFGSDDDLPPISYEIADTDPAIARIEVHGDELWVGDPVAQRRAQDGGPKVVDVFDLDGRLQERRTLVYPHESDQDAIHFLDSGRIVRVKNFRSASRASMAGVQVQVGDKSEEAAAEDEDILLEVIVYAPRAE